MSAAHDRADGEEQQDDAARDLQRRQGDVEDTEQDLAGKDEHQRHDGRCLHCPNRNLAPEVDVGLGRQACVDDQRLKRPDGHQENSDDVDDAERLGRHPSLSSATGIPFPLITSVAAMLARSWLIPRVLLMYSLIATLD